MKEEKTYREPDVQPDDDVIVIDWMGLVRRAWNCRRLLLKAMGVGLVLGCVGSLPVLEPLRKAAQSRPALEAASYPAALVLLALDLIHLSAATFVPFIYFQF